MIFHIFSLLFLAGNDVQPVIDLSGGQRLNEVFIYDSRKYSCSDMAYGPQEYVVDCSECVYIHDINTLDSVKTNRILKFDSTGKFLYIIDKCAVPQLDNVWFGPMTIDPQNNNLIVFGSGCPKEIKVKSQAEVPCYFFRFSESGKLLKAINSGCWQANFLLYDYEGNFFTKYVDGANEFDSSFNMIKEIPSRLSKDHGYSQWTDWVSEAPEEKLTLDLSRQGRFIIQLRHLEDNAIIKCSFYHPPYYSIGGFIEGQDIYGNIYLNVYNCNYLRINPKTKKVAIVSLDSLGILKSCGDVRHGVVISPNGNLYKSLLIRDVDNQLKYCIYRISPAMFIIKECVYKTWRE